MNSTVTQHAADLRKFVSDEDARVRTQATGPDAVIAGSWRYFQPVIIDARTPAQHRTQYAEFVQVAAAEIDRLYGHLAVSESGCTLSLTDTSGIILYERTDATLPDTFDADGGESPRSCRIVLSCSGAPIRDPCGSLIGLLTASTSNARSARANLASTAALVDVTARLIEKCLFLSHFQRAVIFRFHSQSEQVNLQHGGAMALAHDATVIAVDEAALQLLQAGSRAELIGRRIDDIFEVSAEDLIDPSRAQTTLRTVRHIALGQRFFATVDHAMARREAPLQARGVMQLAPVMNRKSSLTLEELAGEDPQMLRNVRSAHRIAMSNVPVMIQGATGAGKEMFARALHAASDRALRPFVALNCAAIPESLIESELFGYRSGAFTGARKEGMKGKILQSSGGTLFLDEIGDMPLALQTRLLRVLEEQEVIPLGTETAVKVDLRVICASHQNLRAMIARGEFREDLYYRLNGITLELPPLARRTDKERLIREFLAAETSDGRPAAIEVDAFQQLLAYRWPGNVRELRNVIRTALAICDGGVVRLRDLPSEVRDSEAADSAILCRDFRDGTSTQQRERPLEEEEVLSSIRACGGNMSRVARQLGISRNTLYRRCKRLGIAPQRWRGVPLD